MITVIIFQHAEIRQLIEQLVERLVVRRVVLLGIHRVQLRVRVMLAYLKEITGQHIEQQIQRRFARYCIHLVFEDARQSPVFRGIGIHLDFTGYAVRNVPNELQQFRIRILIALMFRYEFVRHLWHNILCVYDGFAVLVTAC